MTTAERRAYERYGLELAIKIKWTDPSGKTQEQTGTTKDISSSGIYMICEDCLEEGCEIELEMDIPKGMTGGKESCVCAKGTVLRNEPLSGSKSEFGHAIVLHNHSFSRQRRGLSDDG